MLGHASLLAEAASTAVLMDPVFFDPYEFGRVQAHPPRTVHINKLPPLSAIVLSHGHRDHFDVRTMQTLPATTPVYIPAEPPLEEQLRALGFTHVRQVQAGERVRLGAMELLFTSSLEEDELGVVFTSEHGSVWNQVDTATDQALAVEVLEQLGGTLHVVLAPYNPILEHANVWITETDFPTERYHRLLEAALCSQARCVVPSSCGQSYVPELRWLDHRVFPITPERFLADLATLAPEVQGLWVRPGEAVKLERGRASRVQTPYATLAPEPPPSLSFEPELHPPPPMVHPPRDAAKLEDAAHTAIAAMNRYLKEHLTPTLRGPLRTLWDRRAILQIDIAFPSHTASWKLTRWYPQAKFEPGMVERPGGPDYRFAYRASDIADFWDGQLDLGKADLRIYRRRRHDPADTFRLCALDPGRLNGEDLYYVVDASLEWTPLSVLL